MKIKRFFKSAVGFGAGLGCLQYVLRNRTVIFMFHRVVDEEYYNRCTFQQSILITVPGFRSFLDWARNNFSIVPLSSFMDAYPPSFPATPQPTAVITFDDGWVDNYDNAFPLLQKQKIPATIFLSTNYIGSSLGFWWQSLGETLTNPNLSQANRNRIRNYLDEKLELPGNRGNVFEAVDTAIETIKDKHPLQAEEITKDILETVGEKPVNQSLTWDQCREMSHHGIEFGSHTLSHPRLTQLDQAALTKELQDSKTQLYRNQINVVDAVCYPYGDCNETTLERAGNYYTLGVTTEKGLVDNKNHKPLSLPRINVPEKVAVNRFLMQYRLLKAALGKHKRQ